MPELDPRQEAVNLLMRYAEERGLVKLLGQLLEGANPLNLSQQTAHELHEKLRAEYAEQLTRENAQSNRDPWDQRFNEADAEAGQEEMDLGRPVPDMARRKA